MQAPAGGFKVNQRMSTSAVVMLVCLVGEARADILLDQPHDFVTAAASFISVNGNDFLVADDFRIAQRTRIDSATFYMITTWPNVPWDWGLNIHATTMEHPWNDFPWFDGAPIWDPIHAIQGGASLTDLGPWPTDPTYRYWEVRFDDLNMVLDPADTENDMFWFSPYGVGQNFPLTRSFTGSSGRGEVNGNRAWGRTIPWTYPGWRPVSQNIDRAFRLEGEVIPAPGVIAPFMLLVMQGRRRRSYE